MNPEVRGFYCFFLFPFEMKFGWFIEWKMLQLTCENSRANYKNFDGKKMRIIVEQASQVPFSLRMLLWRFWQSWISKRLILFRQDSQSFLKQSCVTDVVNLESRKGMSLGIKPGGCVHWMQLANTDRLITYYCNYSTVASLPQSFSNRTGQSA